MTETKKAPKRALKASTVTKLDELAETAAVVEQAAVAVEPADKDEAAHETITLDDLITRAGNKTVTQEEVNFVTGVRQKFDVGGLVSEFERRWLEELAAR